MSITIHAILFAGGPQGNEEVHASRSHLRFSVQIRVLAHDLNLFRHTHCISFWHNRLPGR